MTEPPYAYAWASVISFSVRWGKRSNKSGRISEVHTRSTTSSCVRTEYANSAPAEVVIASRSITAREKDVRHLLVVIEIHLGTRLARIEGSNSRTGFSDTRKAR